MLLLSSVLLVALLVCLFELGNYILFFFEGHCYLSWLCKMSEAAATVPAMSEADMLRVIHG